MNWITEHLRLIALAASVVVVVSALGAVLVVRHRTETPWGPAGNVQTVQIRRGAGAGEIGGLLEERGVIRSADWFRLYLRLAPGESPLQAGEYRFETPLSLRQVVEQLRQGRVLHHRLTIPEGLDVAETIEEIVAAGWGDRNELSLEEKRATLVADLDPAAASLEGYLFPETYFFPRDTAGTDILRTMVEHFRLQWTPQRQQQAAALGWSVREVVTLASLIEKETAHPEERPLVSSVFHNRLARGMKLACDPTVIYAVKLVKEYDGIIHRSDLDLDSPYNTYLYAGLPPGPIANPGAASIDAALQPADTDFLYFVSRNDGSHVFSTNYRDHQRAVQRYQR